MTSSPTMLALNCLSADLANKTIWRRFTADGRWVCPYCLNPYRLRSNKETELRRAIQHHVMHDCSACFRGRGTLHDADILRHRAAILDIERLMSNCSSWRVFDKSGRWMDPYQLKPVDDAVKQAKVDHLLLSCIAKHLAMHPEEHHGEWHPVQSVLCACTTVNRELDLAESIKAIDQHPAWQVYSRGGAWMCPYCLTGVEQTTTSAARAKHLIGCPAFTEDHRAIHDLGQIRKSARMWGSSCPPTPAAIPVVGRDGKEFADLTPSTATAWDQPPIPSDMLLATPPPPAGSQISRAEGGLPGVPSNMLFATPPPPKTEASIPVLNEDDDDQRADLLTADDESSDLLPTAAAVQQEKALDDECDGLLPSNAVPSTSSHEPQPFADLPDDQIARNVRTVKITRSRFQVHEGTRCTGPSCQIDAYRVFGRRLLADEDNPCEFQHLIQLENKKIGLVLGRVISGCSSLAAMARMSVDLFADHCESPEEILHQVHGDLVVEMNEVDAIAICIAVLDPKAHELAWCHAGLGSILIHRREKKHFRHLESAGELLRAAAPRVGARTCALHPGDTIVIPGWDMLHGKPKTDGVEPFGAKRLAASLKRSRDLEPEQRVEAIIASALRYQERRSFSMDSSVFLICSD
jgi:hypothetical protein